LRDRGAPQRARFGYSDDDAFAVGLTCGGELDVLVQRIDPVAQPPLGAALAEVAGGRPAAVAQVVDGPDGLIGATLSVLGDSGIADGTPAAGPADEVVVDWPHRYLERTEVDARTAVCVLTHDAKFDIPLLRLALSLPVGYVGAMGSRRTHDERLR
ncbi:XdhC family protein, partial [Streptomyces yerevanensis]|uniref:XdhC family protein n=1 Tax=Streptomyces yerevanensis TaxID=66378 RepID=UPI0005252D04